MPRPSSYRLFVTPEALRAVGGTLGNAALMGTTSNGVEVAQDSDFDGSLLPVDVGCERLLDRNWLIFLKDNETDRALAEEGFFDTIAEHYESEIDPERNRANLRLLLERADVLAGHRVLDFGCGPGVSLRAADRLTLLGCDRSQPMLRLAAARGMQVITTKELSNSENTCDAMVASYVLHLAVPRRDLEAAVRCVRQGGLIAANFHKGLGLAETCNTIEDLRLGFPVNDRALDRQISGPVRVWRRS